MIRLHRDRDNLPPRLTGTILLQRNQTLAQAAMDHTPHAFESSWWKDGKDALKAATGGKCAYCEAPTTTVAHGDVEHFRPKSIYWWLAYTFDNHLFSCQICNQTYKSDRFDLLDEDTRMAAPRYRARSHKDAQGFARSFGGDPASAQDVDALQKAQKEEGALLVDPYLEDPEDFFAWDEVRFPGEIFVIPRKPRGAPKTRAEATIRDLGLNREELRRARWDTFEKLQTFKDVWLQLEKTSDVRKQVRLRMLGMQAPGAPFAAMTRYFIRDEWQLAL